MSDQLQLFETPAAPVRSIGEWEVDTQGKGRKKRAGAFIEESAWDDGSAWTTSPSSTEKSDAVLSTEKTPRFREGDRATVIGGHYVGRECTVTDIDGRWVVVEFDSGRSAVLSDGELSLTAEAPPENPETHVEAALPQVGDRLVWRSTDIAIGIVAKIKNDRYQILHCSGKTLWMSREQVELASIENLAVGDRVRAYGEGRVLEARENHLQIELDTGKQFWIDAQYVYPPQAPTPSASDFSVDKTPGGKRYSKLDRPVSGWIESQEKTVHGNRGTNTYHYHYYRYEIWDRGILQSTPAIRVEPGKMQILSEMLASEFSVDKILERRHHWEKRRKRSN